MRVLVVDDSGVMRKIISRALGELGINEVEEAADGQLALDMMTASGPFDLLITDWNMPVMNGLELVQSLRGSGCAVPIIMVTTKSEKEAVLQAIQAGVNDYVIKPFERDMLRLKIERLVPVA
ncbi:MAG TPA: two-component system response regulator [Planctomycetaceae bacterium]|nr:two-component system response regulator [Planctomycetaceae bacterium]